MAFIIFAKDKPDHLKLRMDTRAVHLEYLKSHGDIVLVAGPIQDESAEPKSCGTMAVIAVDSRAEAEAFAANDPYAKAGLFEKVMIQPWIPMVGQWAE